MWKNRKIENGCIGLFQAKNFYNNMKSVRKSNISKSVKK